MQLHVTVTTSPGLRNFEGVGGYGEGGGVRRIYLTNREALTMLCCKVHRKQLEY